MISRRMSRCGLVFILALTCSVAQGGEPNDAPVQIAFETSATAFGPFSASYAVELWRPFAAKPAYAAGIRLVEPTAFMPVVLGRGLRSDFLQFVVREGDLSQPQKEFLGDARVVFEKAWNSPVVDRSDPNGPQRLLLYAVTQEDARKMAQAYYQYAMDDFQGRVNAYERGIQEALTLIVNTEKRMREVETLMETMSKTLEELRKTVLYRTESEAQEAVGELDRIINAAQVEAAGLKARVQAIQSHLQEARARKTEQDLVERLDTMFVEESILLQGAEARRQMATQLREQANRFMDLKSALAGAARERQDHPETLQRLRRDLANNRGSLESTRQNRPRIPDKVVIYPITWADDASGN